MNYVPRREAPKANYKGLLFRMTRLLSWVVLFTFCLLGLTVLIVKGAQTNSSTQQMSQFFVKDDYKGERLSPEKLNSLKGLLYVPESTDVAQIKLWVENGEKVNITSSPIFSRANLL